MIMGIFYNQSVELSIETFVQVYRVGPIDGVILMVKAVLGDEIFDRLIMYRLKQRCILCICDLSINFHFVPF